MAAAQTCEVKAVLEPCNTAS